jgi:hypothetical protein
MKSLIRCVAAAALLGVVPGSTLLGCSDPPSVTQGKVVSYDPAGRTLLIEEDTPPHQQRALDLTSAEVGIPPAPGNEVRVAYRDRGGSLVAARVMNLTAQKKH